MTKSDARIRHEDLVTFVRAVVLRLGVAPEAVNEAADVVVEADLRGVHSHGLRKLEAVARKALAGEIVMGALPTLQRRVGSAAHFDGHHGYGPVLCSRVLPTAVELAGDHGIGLVVLRNSSHWGCPAYYSRWMAARGFIGIGITNSEPAMPLWGSSAKSMGNNPITIAAPRRDGEPVVLDMALQQISWGGLKLAQEEGRPLPGPWGFDAQGAETSDPATILATGRVRPVGDYKGSGLAFMMEVLTSLLGAGASCYDIAAREREDGSLAHYCQTFIAIRCDLFAGREPYLDAMDRLYGQARSSPLAEGFTEIALPGDRSNALRAEHLSRGIPTGRFRPSLERLAETCGVPTPALAA